MPGPVDAHTHLFNDHRSQGQSLDEAQHDALKNGITSLGTLYVDKFLGPLKFCAPLEMRLLYQHIPKSLAVYID
jgi:hypothetical protein